jgi:hypothetical protein
MISNAKTLDATRFLICAGNQIGDIPIISKIPLISLITRENQRFQRLHH